MIPIPAFSVVLPWLRIGARVVVISAVFSAGAWVNGARWEAKYGALDKSFTVFQNSVTLQGQKSRTAAAERTLAEHKTKEKADARNARMHANNRAVIERLRRERDSASGGGVPPAPASSPRPDLACFDRAQYIDAYRRLVEGLRGLADESTAATVDLDTAKAWAKEALTIEGAP